MKYFIKRAHKYDKLNLAKEVAADKIYDLVQRVTESQSTVINRSYYYKNARQLRYEFVANELDEESVFDDDISEMHYRVILNLLLAFKQNLFFMLNEKKNYTTYNEFIYNFFNLLFFKPIQNNVTIYGTDLNDDYSDGLASLPDYISFLRTLNLSERENIVKKLPEYFKLIFDNFYFFNNDLYLTTNNTKWYYTLYNNPWFTKINIKKKYYKFLQHYLFINDFESFILEKFFLTNGFTQELEFFYSSEGDYNLEQVMFQYKMKNPYDINVFEDMTRLMVMRFDNFIFSLFSQNRIDLLNLVKTDKNFQGFHKLMRQIVKRRHIRERIIVPLDHYFNLKGFISDPIVRYPRWGGYNFQKTLFMLNRIFNSSGYFSKIHNYTFLNKIYEENNFFLKKLLGQAVNLNKNRSYFFYPKNLNQQAFNINSNSNFRNFNSESWQKYYYDDVLSLALQYIENRYRFSDRLFETAPVTEFNEAFDINFSSDFFSLETETDAIWFESEEINLTEEVQSYFYEVKVWDNIIMSLLEYPNAAPPNLLYNDMWGDFEVLDNYVRKNNKFYTPNRYLDPVNDADPFEGYQIVIQEGDLALAYFIPAIRFFYDFILKNLMALKLTLNFLSNNNFLLQNFGTGDYHLRSKFFDDAVIRKNLDQHAIIELFNNLFDEAKFLTSLKYLYKYIFYFFNFFDINLNSHVIINKIILNCLFFFNYGWNFISWINVRTNFPLSRDGINYTTFIFFFLICNFIIWIPFIYCLTLIRNWIYYPLELDDDDLTPEDLEQYYDRNIESFTHPYGITDLESDVGQRINQSIHNLYTFASMNDEFLFDHTFFYNLSTNELMNFNFILDISLKNELLFFNDVTVPGYKFTYNLFDIHNYIDNYLYQYNYKNDLPFYNRIYVEYLHILLGAKVHSTELQLAFQELSYFHYFYFFAYDKYRLNLQSDNNVNLEDLIFNKKKFKNRHFFYKNINTFKKRLYTNNKRNNKKIIDKGKSNLFFNKKEIFEYNSRLSINTNKSIIDYYKETNLPLRTIWLNNKYIFNSLNILNFSFNVLVNNDYFHNLLYYEKININNFLKLNILGVVTNQNSFSFLSKNNLNLMQYLPGDLICPFYLRFYRHNDNTLVNKDFFYNLPADDLLYLYDSNWKFESNFISKFNSISMNDLNYIIPYNVDGVVSFELLFAYILNLKIFFSDTIIFDEISDYEMLVLDFHNYEVNKFYTRSFFSHFFDLEDFGEKFDFTDWIKLIEEQKEWSIFLEYDRFITLNPYDENLINAPERFNLSNQSQYQRRFKTSYLIKRIYNIKENIIKGYIKGFKYFLFYDGKYRRRNRGKNVLFQTKLKYGKTLREFAKYYLKNLGHVRKKRELINSLQNFNNLKLRRLQFLPFSMQTSKELSPRVRSRFIFFEDPKYQLYYDIYYMYTFTLPEKIEYINESLDVSDFTANVISFNDQDLRYLEIFNFPDKNFRFSNLFISLPDENLIMYTSIIQKIKKSSLNSKKLISNQLFFQLISNQFINIDVYHDIYSVLAPEGRAINNRFTELSMLQLYSYMNLHLNLRKTNFFLSTSTSTFLVLLDFIKSKNNAKFTKIKFFIENAGLFIKNLIFLLIFICVISCLLVLF